MIPDFEKVDSLISRAAQEGRFSLLEHEVYEILEALGTGKPPVFAVAASLSELPGALERIPGDTVVLKIAHPGIAHKSDVGGVRIVSKKEAPAAAESILTEAPARHAQLLLDRNEVPSGLAGLSFDELAARLRGESRGVLVCEFVQSQPGFGHELFLGMRFSREFGPVINCGLGGLDTELYAREMVPGRAGVTASPGISDDAEFFAAFRSTVAFETLTGIARGHRKLVEPDTIADILARFHAFVWRCSPLNPDAGFWLTECEINPFLVRDGALVPIDGLLRFSPPEKETPRPPVEKIEHLLKPKSICVIGVSAKGSNIGRVILRNLLRWKFDPAALAIVKEGDDEIDGVKCYPTVADLPRKFDLIVLSVAAAQVPELVREIVEHDKAESINLITGGMGEKEGAENLEEQLRKVILESRARPGRGPVMVGGNSLGIISRPGGYDTMFVPDTKLPKNPDIPMGNRIAMLSQSGAFMISRMSKLGGLLPRYAISTGNQVDLGIGNLLEHLAGDDEIQVFACYIEGFKNMEGLDFAETAKKLTQRGKDVIVYKAGRSSEGRKAASGHTAAIAGDWQVAEAVLTSAGCIVASSFMEWTNLLMLASCLAGRPVGKGRLAAISNAGFETVGMADNLRGVHHHLELAEFSDETRQKLEDILEKYKLTGLVNVRNPLDLTPMAVDQAHAEVARAVSEAGEVDVILHAMVPLSPMMKTLAPGGADGAGIDDPQGFAQLIIKAFREHTRKPFVLVIDSGSLYDAMANMFIMAGVPVFRSADEAVRAFGTWVHKKRALH